MCGDGRKAILSKGKNRCMDERLHSVCCGGGMRGSAWLDVRVCGRK